MPRLRRSDPASPGIRRVRRGRGFSYVDVDGSPMRDEPTLARIAALAIPPAWTQVWICVQPNGHIQAVGTDAAGRRQYRYHDAWRTQRDAQKHDRVVALGALLPAARRRVSTDLASKGLSRERVLACAFRMLDLGSFRIGSEEYADANGTFGLSTLRRADVTVRGSVVECAYRAKGAKEQVQTVDDAELAAVVRELLARDDANPELLGWRDDDGGWHDVRSADVNAYLHDVLGEGFTAKDFRTWNATVLMAAELAMAGPPPSSERARKQVIKTCIEHVSDHLGNTPAVARSSYVDRRIIDRWQAGEPMALRADLAPDTLDRRTAAILAAEETSADG